MGSEEKAIDDAVTVLTLDPPEAEGQLKKGKKISRKLLINKLNYINFQDGSILVHFTHRRYNSTVSIAAKPQACFDDKLTCLWSAPPATNPNLRDYVFNNFSLNDGKKFIQVKGQLLEIHPNGLSVQLPESCYQMTARKASRHACTEITVQCFQSGLLFTGNLLDFSGVSLRVSIGTDSPQKLQWINQNQPVNIVLMEKSVVLYSGECTILHNKGGSRQNVLILRPSDKHIQRLAPKKHRGKREILVPQPTIFFKHPLCKKNFSRQVINISGSGLAVKESEDKSVLFPGLILPQLEISFGSSFSFACKAQVIYKRGLSGEENESTVSCGLVFLDVPVEEHIKLLSLLHQAGNKYSYVCNKVDLDSLWDFFFDTGFVYPEKYKKMKDHKKVFKEVYEKLYTNTPAIARHFVYQDEGVIIAHMAMLRFYENTWLVHHHAARKSENIRAGLIVLSQASRSLNESKNLYSTHMDYVVCYYRPNNKFPRRVFGGFHDYLHDKKGCSEDSFAYFHCAPTIPSEWRLHDKWSLAKSTHEDLIELKLFYEHASAGLMITALDLETPPETVSPLDNVYKELGFKKERHLFSLKMEGALKAIAMVDRSDMGLNMSELTNCIKVVVLDVDALEKEVLELVLSLLSVKFRQPQMPILLYPMDYMARHSFPYEKTYTQWILNLQHLDEYLQYCEGLIHT